MSFENVTVLIIGFRHVEFFVWYRLQEWNRTNYPENFPYWLFMITVLMSLNFNTRLIQFFKIFQIRLYQCLHFLWSFYRYLLNFSFSFLQNTPVSSIKSYVAELLHEDCCFFKRFQPIICYLLPSITKNSFFSKGFYYFSISCNLLTNLEYLNKYCFRICFKIRFKLSWIMKDWVFSLSLFSVYFIHL